MATVRHGSRAGGVALVLAAAVLWSTGGLGIKSVHGAALSIAGWRGLFALPVLAGLVVARAARAGEGWARPLRRPWTRLAAASYAVMVICFVVATRWTTAADAIFIQYTSPVYVALLSWPLLRERVSWRGALACAGVLAGMVLFFGDGLSTTARLGNLVAVASSFGAAGLPLSLRADQISPCDPATRAISPRPPSHPLSPSWPATRRRSSSAPRRCSRLPRAGAICSCSRRSGWARSVSRTCSTRSPSPA